MCSNENGFEQVNGASKEYSTLCAWDYKVPGFHIFEGDVYGGISPAYHLETVKDMVLYDDDVIVASYPKSGTTLTGELCWLIIHKGDVEKSETKNVFQRAPVIDLAPGALGLPLMGDVVRPRVLKSHFNFAMIPNDVIRKGLKTVFVMKNPKDTVVSAFHFYQSAEFLGFFDGSFEDFFEMFLVGNITWGRWFDHVKTWWKNRHLPNVKILQYEYIVENRKQCILELAEFLDVNLDDEVVEKIFQMTDFNEMKKSLKENESMNYDNVVDEKISPFFRKGIIGDWKNHLTEEQSRRIDKVLDEEFKGTGLKFVYGPGEDPK